MPLHSPLRALLAAAALLAAPLLLPVPSGAEPHPGDGSAPAAAEPRATAPEAAAPESSADLPHISAEPPLDDDLLLEAEWLHEEAPDPLEGVNRAVFAFNEGVYRWVLDPVADFYGFVVPSPVRDSVRHFFSNLREPATFVNQLAQRRGRQAGGTGARFLVNSTVGLGGLFDPASRFGLDRHRTDFGQTLAVYGLPKGPYLVVPLMGPANLRDALGNVVDAMMRPDVWLLATAPQLVFVTSDGITGYESSRIHLEELRASSLDFYAALRSAYRMDREARIAELLASLDGGPPPMRIELEINPYRVAPRRSSPRWLFLARRSPRVSPATSSPSAAAPAR